LHSAEEEGGNKRKKDSRKQVRVPRFLKLMLGIGSFNMASQIFIYIFTFKAGIIEEMMDDAMESLEDQVIFIYV
jgi:hypothetical protein